MTEYSEIQISSIIIGERQRKNLGDIKALADSIARLGLINPITIDESYTLIAGERRLTAVKSLGLATISARFYEDLDEKAKALIELEENIKREQLDWKDQALAVHKLHNLYLELSPEQSVAKSAEAIGMSEAHFRSNLSAAEGLLAGNTSIASAKGIVSATNIVKRAVDRAIDHEINNLLETENAKDRPKDEAPPESSIIHGDFIEWAKSYSGRRFNFIHCDFPYGIDHQDSDQGGTAAGAYTAYEDSEDTYWSLCKALCSNLDRLATGSAHVMFWFSMKFYPETLAFFEANSDLTLVDERPLIWHKSDGKGIASDVNRRPRNIYETALLFSRGDRKILQVVDNLYSCPTVRHRLNPSAKPEPMLRHFFRMFINEDGEMLDPTAGSGTSLCAAETLKAGRVLGLELNKEFADEANTSLRKTRNLMKI